MEWYNLFRPHILNRGAEYHQDGYVSVFNRTETRIEAEVKGTEDYHVEIELAGENVIHMTCDCPHAESGNNCKHMAAVLFRFEEELYNEDIAKEDKAEIEIKELTWKEQIAKRRENAMELVNKIPEEEVRNLLVGFVMEDASLRSQLELTYSEHFDAKQMLLLKDEIQDIVHSHSRRGYVDWYHASDFTSALSYFLQSKVTLLIERHYLEQAFELTNYVFHCIGNIDMDDSDGGSSYVADKCYECWKMIVEKSDESGKTKMKRWFESHQDGYVVDYIEEYLQEFLASEFPTEELIRETIKELDEIISKHSDSNDCVRLYSNHYGYENVIIKRIEYMRKLGCTEDEIMEYRSKHRHFFAIRELEIAEALNKQDYVRAKELLLESKEMDTAYQNQIQKYSKQLIEIYDVLGEKENYCAELLYQLENYYHLDLHYFLALKAEIGQEEQWEETVNRIIASNRNEHFVCEILNEEKRYREIMNIIEKNDNVYLLDKYESNIKKVLPESVIACYQRYIFDEVRRVSDRKGYHHIMQHLQKIHKCPGGKEVASKIAAQWRVEYKRRSAMMDELSKIGL
ncbi:MAG: SWIM zinc finger family protein [Lachnospiraceae bacterium]|nr:SWIM zinc finger family protein [Lachnospiraceae bacterium]